MKTCKACGKEIAKSAKVCPNCGKKNGLPGIVKLLIIVVIVLGCIIGCVNSCSNAVSDSIEETENSYNDINNKTWFKLNETFENKYMKLTMKDTDLNFKEYNEYLGPRDGYNVIMVKFDGENIGDSDQYLSIFDFNCYADDVAMEDYLYANDNYTSLNATLSKGKKSSGYGFYEVPKDAKKLQSNMMLHS